MSSVVITADTKTRIVTVSVDGQELADFYSASIYFDPKASSDNPYKLGLELCCMSDADRDEGEIRKMTRYCASQDGKLSKVEPGDVEKEIAEYFSS